MVGLPGIAIGLLIKLLIREPRACSEFGTGRVDRSGPAARLVSGRTAGTMGRRQGLAPGPSRPSHGARREHRRIRAYGFYAFVHPYFRRAFDLDYTTVGVMVGLAGGVAVGMGIVAGGFVADALATRDARWYALVPAIGGIAVPFYLCSLPGRTTGWRPCCWRLRVSCSMAPWDRHSAWCRMWSIAFPAGSNSVPGHICLSVFALGCGPLFTGWVTDRSTTEYGSQSVQATLPGRPRDFICDQLPGRRGRRIRRRRREIRLQPCAGARYAPRTAGDALVLWMGVARHLFAVRGIAKSLRKRRRRALI